MPYPYYAGLNPASSPYAANTAIAPYNYTPPPQNAPTGISAGIQWVQGESGAKSHPVAPNSTALLMDSEAQKFYIKTVDISGMPQPLRTFTYEEVKTETSAAPAADYITRAEFEKALAELAAPKKAVKKDE